MITALSVRELAGFATVGVLNTSVDFILFNVLVSRRAWSSGRAHACSSSAAMLVSFALNRMFIFPGPGGWERLPHFLAVTALSIYGLQPPLLLFFERVASRQWLECFGLSRPALRRNAAKALATAAGLAWNFACYKWYVFAG